MTTSNNTGESVKRAFKVRLAVLQRVCPPYRVPLFRELTKLLGDDFCLFIGDDVPRSKVRNASDLSGVNHLKLKTKFFELGTRVLPYHVRLSQALRAFNPDVVLCEGESHFLGYLQAIFYRYFYKRKVGLIHWCFISLPGEPLGGRGIRAKIKAQFRRFFDAFLVYSSFSKDVLQALGEPEEKIFVATNVTDTSRSLQMADSIHMSKQQARAVLGLKDVFTILYLGTLDKVKKPNLLLEIAQSPSAKDWSFLFVGTGPLLDAMTTECAHLRLANVNFAGRVTDALAHYLRASDVLVVPGRGGIVFSEAMAFELPVIVHQADGTEYDLVRHDQTGLRVNDGSSKTFEIALMRLALSLELRTEMGRRGRQLVETEYTISNMVKQIIRAATYVTEKLRPASDVLEGSKDIRPLEG
jgi:glycosyltransferase involved in cell wall biosynthesis